MQTQRVILSDPERITRVVLNVDGSGSFTTGMGVVLCEAGASIDGISAIKYVGTKSKGFAGVAAQDIPINGYGLIITSGYAASVLLSHVGTSLTVTRGDVLIAGAVAGTFFSSTLATNLSTLTVNDLLVAGVGPAVRYVYTADTITISAPAYVRGIVKGGL